MDLFEYLPDASQAANLVTAFLTMIGFVAVGGALSGAKRNPLFDTFTGFGAVTGVMTVIGVFSEISFFLDGYRFLVGYSAHAALTLYRDSSTRRFKSLLKLRCRVTICLPVLISVAAMNASQWDEFSQWLFNALYIYKFELFLITSFRSHRRYSQLILTATNYLHTWCPVPAVISSK